MIALVELDILKGVAAALSILLSVRKLYRWIRRKLNKRKPPYNKVGGLITVVFVKLLD